MFCLFLWRFKPLLHVLRAFGNLNLKMCKYWTLSAKMKPSNLKCIQHWACDYHNTPLDRHTYDNFQPSAMIIACYVCQIIWEPLVLADTLFIHHTGLHICEHSSYNICCYSKKDFAPTPIPCPYTCMQMRALALSGEGDPDAALYMRMRASVWKVTDIRSSVTGTRVAWYLPRTFCAWTRPWPWPGKENRAENVRLPE